MLVCVILIILFLEKFIFINASLPKLEFVLILEIKSFMYLFSIKIIQYTKKPFDTV